MSTLFGSVSTEAQHTCDVFVIMPFKPEFKEVYTHVIKKVCDELNLDAKLGDDFFSNRQIMNEIWSAINNCRLVIAEVTERNANVYYELGISHALGKNTIAITKKKEDIPFDINGVRYIFYTDTIPGAKVLEDELRKAIEKMLSNSTTTKQSSSEHPLQRKDRIRYELSLSKDVQVLKDETAKALKLNEYDWMILFAQAWIAAAPGASRAYEDLGKAFNRSNQPRKAIEVGEQLVKLSKINYAGYQILGEAYGLLGEWEEAKKWQEIALRYVPSMLRWIVLADLSETYQALGLVEEAIATLEEIIPLVDKIQQSIYQETLDHLKNIR